MYELLGICLALAALLTCNALASLLAVILWRSAGRMTGAWSARARARVLFALRVLPPASAAVCVVMLLIPAYLVFEPRVTTEAVSLKLAVIASLSVIGIALAIWRGLVTWHATRRLVDDWLRHAEPIRLKDVLIPTYRIEHRFPVIAVVGAIRPRLFIANQVFDSLSDEELTAAVAHELGHLAVHDNLKRALVRACRDMLMIVPCGRSLDRAWAESTEAAADEHAAHAVGAAGALDLAAALVKIARIAPVDARPTMPAGAFLIDEGVGDVVWRVRRLTELAAIDNEYQRRWESFPRLVNCICLCCVLAAIIFMATNSHTLMWMHTAIEHVVSALQ